MATGANITENDVEEAALGLYSELGYQVLFGPDIAPGEPDEERSGYDKVVLEGRLRDARVRLNPDVPTDAIDEAFRKVLLLDSPSLIQRNRNFHRMLVNGIEVEHQHEEGRVAGSRVRLVDFETLENNDWLAVNQFTVIEDNYNRRPDVVAFVNGLPLAVLELKNPTDETATIWSAYNQLQTYKNEIPSLFA